MIFYLNIFINVCLIFAVWRVSKKPSRFIERTKYVVNKPQVIAKDLAKYYQTAKVAEKFAERAFNLASTANIGIVALQKAMHVPRIMNKEQVQKNQLANKRVDELFQSGQGFDWLRPILNDEEQELLDRAIENSEKQMMKDVPEQ